MILGQLTPTQFLEEYWQKQQLVVRNALSNYQSPITPEEFAGLAMEEDVESRLIQYLPENDTWQLRHGPFLEDDFTSLPLSNWTLLIQGINQHIEPFAELLDFFDFLPNWRLDDIMASYSPPGGTVGPHTDNYDVFIIQLSGSRRWLTNGDPERDESYLEDLPVRILRNFHSTSETILQTGDMIYIPAGVAHHGITIESGLSLSIGYRAPTHGDLLAGFYGDKIADLDTESFYSDKHPQLTENPGEISLAVRNSIRAIIRQIATDDATIDHWFGQYITKGSSVEEYSENDFTQQLIIQKINNGEELYRSEHCTFSYFKKQEQVAFFAAGEQFILSFQLLNFIELICGQRRYDTTIIGGYMHNSEAAMLLTTLCNSGALYFAEQEYE